VEGDRKPMSDDEEYQNTSDSSASGSGDINIRGQFKLLSLQLI